MRKILTVPEIADRTRAPLSTVRFWVTRRRATDVQARSTCCRIEDEVDAWIEQQAAAAR